MLIRSIEKAFKMLELIGTSGELGVSEMVKALRWKKSTVHRLASTLEEIGYLDQNQTTLRYRLSNKLFWLGNLVRTTENIRTLALPYLQALQDRSTESVYLGMMESQEVLYIEHVPSKHLLQPMVHVGSKAPLHCTAIGKALLLGLSPSQIRRIYRQSGMRKFTDRTITSINGLERNLEESRKRGFTVDDEEYHPGVRSIAVPIRDEEGQVIAGVSIAGASARIHLKDLPEMVDVLLKTSNSISNSLSRTISANRRFKARADEK